MVRRGQYQECPDAFGLSGKDFGKRYGVAIEKLGLLARAILLLMQGHSDIRAACVPEVTHEPDYAAAIEAIRAAK